MLRDKINIISKQTPVRILNAGKVWLSYYLSRLLHEPSWLAAPISVSIEPTTSCNLRCPECPSGKREFTRSTGMLEMNFFKTAIDQLYKKTTYLTFYFQGEPYLNPSFLEMVQYASSKKMYTATSTNAHYLNDDNSKKTIESGLDRLIISIDGTTQETYEAYRVGGELKKVLEGAKNIVKWKKQLKSKTPHVIFQFLVVKPNEHQTAEVKKLAKEIGVDEVKFKTAQLYDFMNGNPLIPSIEKYSRYTKDETGEYRIKNELHNHCWRLWHSCVITWDGKIVPCCFDKDASHQMGELKNRSFNDIWRSETYNNFRKSVLLSRKNIDICSNCSEGTKVWT